MSHTNTYVLIDPGHYEYLWTDRDVNYLFVSCYLSREFRGGDFVLLYDPKQNGVAFYLSRKDRKRFSRYGLRFFKTLYPAWERRMRSNLSIVAHRLRQAKRERRRVSGLPEAVLLERFRGLVRSFQLLGGGYFYTEFFFFDKVEQMHGSADAQSPIAKRLRRMAKIKLRARALLNTLYNYRTAFQPYVDEIGRRHRRADVAWLSHEEIVRLHLGQRVPLCDRQHRRWVLAKRNHWRLLTGPRAIAMAQKFERSLRRRAGDAIRGTVANRGRYIGRVSNIPTLFSDRLKAAVAKVKSGDVLVANTTGPEIMAACERAGAIVTDEGGLTSHAAIISRELNIPCIVGTRYATHVLKTGDRVEVDAVKGSVRKV